MTASDFASALRAAKRAEAIYCGMQISDFCSILIRLSQLDNLSKQGVSFVGIDLGANL